MSEKQNSSDPFSRIDVIIGQMNAKLDYISHLANEASKRLLTIIRGFVLFLARQIRVWSVVSVKISISVFRLLNMLLFLVLLGSVGIELLKFASKSASVSGMWIAGTAGILLLVGECACAGMVIWAYRDFGKVSAEPLPYPTSQSVVRNTRMPFVLLNIILLAGLYCVTRWQGYVCQLATLRIPQEVAVSAASAFSEMLSAIETSVPQAPLSSEPSLTVQKKQNASSKGKPRSISENVAPRPTIAPPAPRDPSKYYGDTFGMFVAKSPVSGISIERTIPAEGFFDSPKRLQPALSAWITKVESYNGSTILHLLAKTWQSHDIETLWNATGASHIIAVDSGQRIDLQSDISGYTIRNVKDSRSGHRIVGMEIFPIVLTFPPIPPRTSKVILRHSEFVDFKLDLVHPADSRRPEGRYATESRLVLRPKDPWTASQVKSSESKPLLSRVFAVTKDTVPPSVIEKVEPELGRDPKQPRLSGFVIVYLEIDRNGKPENIRLIRRLRDDFDSRVLSAISQWKFEPAKKDGETINVAVTIEVRIRLI